MVASGEDGAGVGVAVADRVDLRRGRQQVGLNLPGVECLPVKCQDEAPVRIGLGGRLVASSVWSAVSVSLATRGQTECAGWLPQAGRSAGADRVSRVERHEPGSLLTVGSRVAPRAATAGNGRRSRLVGQLFLPDCQRPAPASEFAGNRDVGDHEPLLAVDEPDPGGMQTSVADVAADPCRGRGEFHLSRMGLPGR
jgi:hypothetical protein